MKLRIAILSKVQLEDFEIALWDPSFIGSFAIVDIDNAKIATFKRKIDGKTTEREHSAIAMWLTLEEKWIYVPKEAFEIIETGLKSNSAPTMIL